MAAIDAYWAPTHKMDSFLFSIRKEKRTGFFDVSEVQEAILPFFAFTYLTEGEVLLEIEGQPWLCQAGQLLVVPRNIPFRILHFKESVSYECGFSLRALKDISYSCLHDLHPLHQNFRDEDGQFTVALLELLLQAHKQGNQALVASALDLFLCRLNNQHHQSLNPVVNQFLEKVFDRSRRPGKVTDYARELYITPNYLNRLVRTHTGHSAMEWIEISRMNLAKSLLKRQTLQVAEIAAAVGIDDQSYFTRFFKKNEGCTPSQFREQAQRIAKKQG